MSRSGKKVTYFIKLGRNIPGFGIKYAWDGRESDYKGVGDGLGVQIASASEDGLVFGANRPQPARVRITTTDGKSYMRWCDSGRIDDVTLRRSINGKSFMGSKVKQVTLVKG